MKFYKIPILAISLLSVAGNIFAQNNYSLFSYLATINGTSTLHSWKQKVEKIRGNGDVKQNNDKSCTLQSFKIIMQVTSIKTEEYPLMNNSTYKALKATKFPEITFILDEPVANINYGPMPCSTMAKGRLTIAGVTRAITMSIKIAFNEDKKMTIDVEQQLKMTDYDVDPPTMLFGLIKTGDMITINFRTTFLIVN
ncbi:MAG TPA: YceI family protein [Mucilaginibacter sp.]|jgi:polyisoprenoid-binding protein YceI